MEIFLAIFGKQHVPKNFIGALSYMTEKGANSNGLWNHTAMVPIVPSWLIQSPVISFLICEMGTRSFTLDLLQELFYYLRIPFCYKKN